MHRRHFVTFGLLGVLFAPHATAQRRSVEVGYTPTLQNVAAAKAAGFEYVELSTTELAGLSDADFEQAAAHLRQVGLPVPAAYLFLPPTLKVTGPDIDPEQQIAYVRKAFTRLARLGTQIVVFGSGPARRVPDGFPKAQAFQLHMANPAGRVFPRSWEEYDYAPFFAALKAIGYDKRISVEASTKDLPSDAPLAVALLHKAFR